MSLLTCFFDAIELQSCRVVDFKMSSFVWLLITYIAAIAFLEFEVVVLFFALYKGSITQTTISLVLGIVPTLYARYILGQSGHHLFEHIEEWFA